ncbi:WLM-domain-containing protein [Xylona heveae TC161]|uniref:WLM-domain-containing protein n=1 Tax=Xylona heveae (strain CBS 132557 / TC161) TaxID=1328760 RepID=A0A165JB34_XYLHT|nr:WLM-domain-containing protein [Xylona heveae TC161]KZF25996.1 WLM-domain-containing protein [Xylona heveae TC161]
MKEIDPLVSAYEHLRGKTRDAEALRILQRVASLVKPIMRQRMWRVGVLTEFYPPEHNLLGLNWNRGQKICLRLRYPQDERQFLPIEQVIDTMLHELCHIVHGPHNEHFHALWNQLRDEHEELIRKGYTGEGFLTEGKRLGGNQIPLHEARRLARVAAERRRTLTKGSGQKLGGAPVSAGSDMRRVIADATSRRINVTQGCASNTKESQGIMEQATRNGFRTQAEEDDANERAIIQAYIELLQEEEKEKWGDAYIPPSADNPAGSADKNGYDQGFSTQSGGPSSSAKPPSVPMQTRPSSARIQSRPISRLVDKTPGGATANTSPIPSTGPGEEPPLVDLTDSPPRQTTTRSRPSHPLATFADQGKWTCTICTCDNPRDFLICDACGIERYQDPFSPPTFSSLPQTANSSKPANPSTSSNTVSAPPPQQLLPSRPPPGKAKTKTKIKSKDQKAKGKTVDAATSGSRSNLYTPYPVYPANKPLGWNCHSCGTFMETGWWTCSLCGTMKLSS